MSDRGGDAFLYVMLTHITLLAMQQGELEVGDMVKLSWHVILWVVLRYMTEFCTVS